MIFGKPVEAFVEMSLGTDEKWEFDTASGLFFLDRRLEVRVPANYGFCLDTTAEDGDALDVFILGPQLVRGLTVAGQILGMFECEDNGVDDHKLVMGPVGDEFQIDAIEQYLKTYKTGFKVRGWQPPSVAERVYKSCKKSSS